MLLQTQFLLHVAALLPDLSHLDPRRGLARVFSLNNTVDTLKAIVKAGIMGWALWSVLAGVWPILGATTEWEPAGLFNRLGQELLHATLLGGGMPVGHRRARRGMGAVALRPADADEPGGAETGAPGR